MIAVLCATENKSERSGGVGRERCERNEPPPSSYSEREVFCYWNFHLRRIFYFALQNAPPKNFDLLLEISYT